mmetsp:Transcript_91417/g.295749  ORF Transcript_91417/g.295749 Transcript_91417/m.295749 type:complete len:358 (+) Transcript_91417:2828-3901(+)
MRDVEGPTGRLPFDACGAAAGEAEATAGDLVVGAVLDPSALETDQRLGDNGGHLRDEKGGTDCDLHAFEHRQPLRQPCLEPCITLHAALQLLRGRRFRQQDQELRGGESPHGLDVRSTLNTEALLLGIHEVQDLGFNFLPEWAVGDQHQVAEVVHVEEEGRPVGVVPWLHITGLGIAVDAQGALLEGAEIDPGDRGDHRAEELLHSLHLRHACVHGLLRGSLQALVLGADLVGHLRHRALVRAAQHRRHLIRIRILPRRHRAGPKRRRAAAVLLPEVRFEVTLDHSCEVRRTAWAEHNVRLVCRAAAASGSAAGGSAPHSAHRHRAGKRLPAPGPVRAKGGKELSELEAALYARSCT